MIVIKFFLNVLNNYNIIVFYDKKYQKEVLKFYVLTTSYRFAVIFLYKMKLVDYCKLYY